MTPNPLSDHCERCHRWYGTDPALVAMREAVPGSAGYYRAMESWSGEPCECPDGPLASDESQADD
jgi:hypothetical protein